MTLWHYAIHGWPHNYKASTPPCSCGTILNLKNTLRCCNGMTTEFIHIIHFIQLFSPPLVLKKNIKIVFLEIQKLDITFGWLFGWFLYDWPILLLYIFSAYGKNSSKKLPSTSKSSKTTSLKAFLRWSHREQPPLPLQYCYAHDDARVGGLKCFFEN